MTLDEIKSYCLSKLKAYEYHPFGQWPICFKVNGKIFAQAYPDKITLKCSAFSGQAFRVAYPGVVVRGYHCPPVQQPYWNTIDLGRFPHKELSMMIDHAYDTVVGSFPKKVQREIRGDGILGRTVTVTVDRPLGSFHPKHPDMYYPINYGYIEGVFAADGEEQDAYILGIAVPVKEFTGRVIAIIHRRDDVEDKWVVAPDEMFFTRKEIEELTPFQEQYFDTEIII